MMMDDERHKKEYNAAREVCLLRSGTLCKISITGNIHSPYLGKCKIDEHKNCPLFVFIKNVPGVAYHND